ncbi:hypothetical protein ABI59_04720 [Acidobacteria bacterium Mor1]|nr:hypothetical protein ABI59_04720 [Acidobacteria bacterium Mor1]
MSALTDRLKVTLVPALGYRFIRLLHLTMRVESVNKEAMERAVEASGGHYLIAFWHARFLLMPYACRTTRLVALLSRHTDAEILAGVLGRFGYSIARGSSTRGGVSGIKAILRKVKEGYDVGIAPDGPKGPRRRAKIGTIAIARMAGLPIVPVSYSAGRARRLRNWDQTFIPKLFSRGVIVYGEPIHVPRDADDEEQERLRLQLEQELDRLTDEADRHVGFEVESDRPPVEAA